MHHNFRHHKPWLIIPMIFGGILLAVAMAFLFGYFVMLLWNWLMPVLFGLKIITYWQAWGLVLLAHILFKFNPMHHGHHHRGRHFDKEEFKVRMKERFHGKCCEDDEKQE